MPMPEVLQIRHLQVCLDSSIVVEVELDQTLDEACMRRIAAADRLEYFPDFPRPLFRIMRRGVWAIQGILGTVKLRVTYLPDATDSAESELRCRIAGR
jgi:hypothetical protein